ncbi:hypothetical protein Cflav_PD5044 [Pedosphaera parvula Ellin514]|uniref:Uncharacterized protein n=2 Tax=Pedosphaera TaxID=1032526 RepID=B9XBU1_PEDPL|nr:hypothetical protein Cflav_PD5044 [Pedosphaera parvula Ellin514]
MAAAFLALSSGCTTQTVGQLWADEDLDHFYSPSRYGDVQVFQKNQLANILITYEEDHGGKLVRRAFFVLQDGDRVDGYGKPAFVSPKISEGMQPIPSDYGEFTDIDRLRKETIWARVSSDNSCVMILTNGISAGSYELPSYSEINVRRKLALTTGAILFEGLKNGAEEKLSGRDSQTDAERDLNNSTKAKSRSSDRK